MAFKSIGDLINSTDFILKLFAFLLLLAAFIYPFIDDDGMPTPGCVPGSKKAIILSVMFYATTGGGIITMIALLYVIYKDRQRHTAELVFLALNILACLITGCILIFAVKGLKNHKGYHYACPSLLIVAALIMMLDFFVEWKYNSGYDCCCM